MKALATSDYPEFFREIWKVKPFAWQEELLAQVVEEGQWPSLIDLPTGTGKTSTIDIALFALALDAAKDPVERQMPRRIAMIVDRRIVVDQAHDRADVLKESLAAAVPGTVCAQVRDALVSLSGGGPALNTSVLRGGIVRDETWARRPDVPAVLASTVDQIGSRLLFRGYGLSTGMRPIHAGLLSADTLFLLDEVHLARPFADTMARFAEMHARSGHTGAASPPQRSTIVQLSATPNQTMPVDRFPATPLAVVEDAAPGSPAEVLNRRLEASKTADLVEVKTPTDAAKSNEALAKAVEREFVARFDQGKRIAIMVNRVDTARRIAGRLSERAAKDESFDVVLLTGRMRPVDRDRVLKETSHGSKPLVERLKPGERGTDERPVVVVATQSLEAGADFDFDLLITECASLDALRQRFGRVNRAGESEAVDARSVVLCRAADVDPKVPDPVYGLALPRTWAWLLSQDAVDFGYQRMGEAPLDLYPVPDQAPVLGSTHLNRWVQTTERSVGAEPEVAQWLHGVGATDEIADVQVVWRDSLGPELFGVADAVQAGVLPSTETLSELLTELLSVVPPLAAEALSVPIREVRRWLQQELPDPVATDTPIITDEEPSQSGRPGGLARSVARWAERAAELIHPKEIRPGDTIVVPAAYGGLALNNWDPSSTGLVADRSFELSEPARRVAVVRLDVETCAEGDVERPDPEALQQMRASDRKAAIKEAVDVIGPKKGLPKTGFKSFAVARGLDESGRVLRDYLVTGRVQEARSDADDLAVDAGDDGLSLIGQRILLKNHLKGVGCFAHEFSKNLGWPAELIRAVQLAGELHDVGKADRRFQAILNDGQPNLGELLAKSGQSAGDTGSQRAARRASGYPSGARHELQSLAMIDGEIESDGIDVDLVLHLVATHHGWGRYRFRPVFDGRPEAVSYAASTTELDTLDLKSSSDHGFDALNRGHSERFWRLVRAYGWWTLAQVETVLRLADHWRSHLEQTGGVSDEDVQLVEEGA